MLQSTIQYAEVPDYKKLYFVELRNPDFHPEIGENTEVFKKVWNIQCKKQESSDSQIGADEDDRN